MKKTIKQTCFSYFEGSIDEASAKTVLDFIHSSEGNRTQFKKWENEWKNQKSRELETGACFKRITERNKKQFRTRMVAASTAACLCLVCAFGLFSHFNSLFTNPEIPDTINYFTVQTGFCEQTTVILPDSTSVTLNAASKVRYANNFMQGDRSVFLEGEAYFDVTKNKEHPFVVNMADGKITVFGTKFNVSSYSGEKTLEAALLEGSIQFETSTASVSMQPGDMVSYSVSDDSLEKKRGDVAGSASWTSGSLRYADCSLDKLLGRISSIYGITIEYVPTVGRHLVLGAVLNLREPAENILDAIAAIVPIEWYPNVDGSYTVKDII